MFYNLCAYLIGKNKFPLIKNKYYILVKITMPAPTAFFFFNIQNLDLKNTNKQKTTHSFFS